MEKEYQPDPINLNDELDPAVRDQVEKSVQEGYGDSSPTSLIDQSQTSLPSETVETTEGPEADND